MISVIDDDASVRAAIGNLLQSLGYVTHVFESAEEFLRSDHLDQTSCVIADVNMPVMSGVEPPARSPSCVNLVRGIHPPVLADRGLADAVRALVLDCPLRARLAADLPGLLPPRWSRPPTSRSLNC